MNYCKLERVKWKNTIKSEKRRINDNESSNNNKTSHSYEKRTEKSVPTIHLYLVSPKYKLYLPVRVQCIIKYCKNTAMCIDSRFLSGILFQCCCCLFLYSFASLFASIWLSFVHLFLFCVLPHIFFAW